jgi:type II secretory pathway pseudopilin PulG
MFYRSSALFKKTPNRFPANAGFSMVELMVSIGIVVMVLSVVVTRQNAFNGAVLLRGQAYEIALAMREVQLGAISASSDGSGQFRSVQGMHFDVANNQQYYLFRDTDGNQFRNDTGSEDFGFSGIIDPRFEIRSIEYGLNNLNELSVVFQRPNFDAIFVTNDSGAILNEQSVNVVIGLRGGGTGVCGEDTRTIQITSAGQIAVTECP